MRSHRRQRGAPDARVAGHVTASASLVLESSVRDWLAVSAWAVLLSGRLGLPSIALSLDWATVGPPGERVDAGPPRASHREARSRSSYSGTAETLAFSAVARLLAEDAVGLLLTVPSLVSAPLVAREYRSLHPERGREKRARSGPGVMRGASTCISFALPSLPVLFLPLSLPHRLH